MDKHCLPASRVVSVNGAVVSYKSYKRDNLNIEVTAGKILHSSREPGME